MVQLHVGCGQGAWARRVAERFADARVRGVDLEESNVAIAQRDAAASSAAARLSWSVANAYNLCADVNPTAISGGGAGAGRSAVGFFDFVSCRSMLYTVPRPQSIVSEILRALRPDGGVAASGRP